MRARATVQWLLGPTDEKKRLLAALCVVGVVAALWLLHACLYPIVFPVDDAYITLHNALTLVSGPEVNYAGTPALVGATSLLHLLLVAAFSLIMPGEWALHSVMWLGAAAYALGVARLAFAQKASVGEALLIVAIALTVGEVPHQLMNGLETGWAMAALVWTLALASEGPRSARSAAIGCGMLPLWRPELALASGIIFCCLALQRWRDRQSWRATVRAQAGDLLALGLVILPAILTYWLATGSPVPTTIGAKQHWFAEGCLPLALKWQWVSEIVLEFAGLLGPLSAVVVLLALSPLGRGGAIFILGLLAAYFNGFPGALRHYEYRYLYVVLPFLLYGLMAGLHHPRRIIRNAALGLAVVAGVFAFQGVPSGWRRHVGFVSNDMGEVRGAAAWVMSALPKSARLLVHDAGYIAFGTDRSLVDLVGLKTPHAADIHREITWPTCGHRRGAAIDRIARDEHVDHLVVLKDWDRIYSITQRMRVRGWTLHKLRDVEGPGYQVYRLLPPAGQP